MIRSQNQYPVDMVVETVLDGYRSYRKYFRTITDRAMERFIHCDWNGTQADASERLDAYQKILQQTVTAITGALPPELNDRELWTAAKSAIAPEIEKVSDPDLAETLPAASQKGCLGSRRPSERFRVPDVATRERLGAPTDLCARPEN